MILWIFFTFYCGIVHFAPFSDGAGKHLNNKFIDLTYALNNETVLWPGRTATFTDEFKGYTETGFWLASRAFCTSEHSSTHIDAPFHFYEDGRKLHEIPLEDMIDVPGVMLDIYDKVHHYSHAGKLLKIVENYALTREDIIEWEHKNGLIPQGSVVLLRTGWGGRWSDSKQYRGEKEGSGDANQMNFPGFSPATATYLAVERCVLGVGIDTLSVDSGDSKTFSSHRIFARRNIYMLENVANLHSLPARGFHLWVVPFKIDFGTGAPTRVLARLSIQKKRKKMLYSESEEEQDEE